MLYISDFTSHEEGFFSVMIIVKALPCPMKSISYIHFTSYILDCFYQLLQLRTDEKYIYESPFELTHTNLIFQILKYF